MKLFEVIPLSIFVFYIRFMDIQTVEDWHRSFIISGVVACVAIILFMLNKVNFNRLFLGVNLYLVSGAIAIITQQFWLNEIYAELHASGMLIWMVIVGFVSSIWTPHGFIGIEFKDKNTINKFSLFLFLTSICAFSLSFAFRGNIILSEIVPFTLVFFTKHILTNKIVSMKDRNITI